MASVVGVCTGYKPFPRIIEKNMHVFNGVKSVVDIGAGDGRFARWFLRNFDSIEVYVAIEPHPRLVRKLSSIGDDRLIIIEDVWENVRHKFIGMEFDVVVFWDVLMFMDLDPYKVLEETLGLSRKFYLFSLHPTKQGILRRDRFGEILSYLDNHPRLELIAKKRLNRLYKKRFLNSEVTHITEG